MSIIAVSMFRSRIAPVFDFSRRVLLINLEHNREIKRTEFDLQGLSLAERVGVLTRAGVTILICGGISDALYTMFEKWGVCVICGVAGPVKEVLAAFMSNRLDDPQFYMPGHRGKKGVMQHVRKSVVLRS